MTLLGTAGKGPPLGMDVPTLSDLGLLRRRITDGLALLSVHDLPGNQFEQHTAKFTQAKRIYQNNLELFRGQCSSLERRALIETYEARLNVGWERPDTAAVVERFSQVLSEYQALCDAEVGRVSVAWHLDVQYHLIEIARDVALRSKQPQLR